MIKKSKNKQKSVRLTSQISPSNYKLTLHPDILSSTFSGQEIIKIKIEKEVRQITLHSKDLDIETVKYTYNKKEYYAVKISYDVKMETVTFIFKNKIPKSRGKLSIVFSGIINDNLRGFYKSKYMENGIEKHLATTQFEATDARRAFPCFDEPAHKAVFEISLIIKENNTAISNTLPIEIKEQSGGFKIVSFAPSPKMSTYLLAFIIGEFEYIEGFSKNKISIRVFTTKNKRHQSKFALEVAIKSLDFFEEYFDIAYPMPNLDLIAIPDFEPAGMENWGAITFRESSILIDEEHSSLTNKQWVATTVAHELAHQWFGNLVTMHWWTDLWLNEGFASYMEKVCTDKIFPEWKVWDLYLSNGRYRNAIEIDSLKNTHAIEVELNHPDEINETFDMVSYEKGTAIIRMLSEFIGDDKFRDGLRYYLKKHSYKNTKTINLWEAFEKTSKKPIKKIMNSWTKQEGFPLVSLINSPKNIFNLKQEKFFSSRITRKENANNKLWEIPIIYKNESSNKKVLLHKKIIKLPEEIIKKINVNESSFIKVYYDTKTLNYLKNNIEANQINTIDRLGIIRDIFALTEGGYIKTDIALEFSLAYKNEKEYIVWSEIAYGINKIFNLIRDEESIIKFKKYALSLYSPLVKKVSFEKKYNEDSSYTLLRILAISQAAYYGDKIIIDEAIKIFNNREIKSIDPDMRSVIYNIVAQNGGLKEWKILENMFRIENLNEEKERLSKAMTQFRNESMINKTLLFAISKNVRDQDAPSIIATSWNNKYGQDATWQFIKNNWNMILKKYGVSGLLLSRLMYILGNHTSTKDLIDAKKFFNKNVSPGAERTLEQAYERITSNIAWIKDDKKSIENWLNKNY
jgi:puromycin-sensitive aminopeptidase